MVSPVKAVERKEGRKGQRRREKGEEEKKGRKAWFKLIERGSEPLQLSHLVHREDPRSES